MSTYTAEAEHLDREYTKATGYALAYGILTYYPGSGRPGDLGPWQKALGDLTDEIRAHERRHNITDGMFPPPPPRKPSTDVQAYCLNGHAMTLWGNSPMMGPSGQQVRWWGSAFLCSCGATARYGRGHLR